ncbi:trypsin alpha-3-like [Culicoides brevitarsis]|uniref:trypsin alpha-3-like n=1 Tax=Culicoides brevitarsis TaxID=469753 RepID=UPI00307B32E5
MKSIILIVAFVVYAVADDNATQEAVVVPSVNYTRSPMRIVGGSPALSHQFPWQASVTSCSGRTCSLCGGSLITRKHVLTAAHCTRGLSSFTIGLGSNRRNQPAVSVVAKSKKEHPNYNPQSLANDVSIITLLTSVNLNNQVKLIALATSGIGTLANHEAFVSGYGKTSDSSGPSITLNYLTMKIIDNYSCSRVYGPQVQSSTLCAVGKASVNKNVCSGDSGGPLVIKQNGNYVQVGVVSYVAAVGCSAGYPSGYARVSSFRTWIDQNTN